MCLRLRPHHLFCLRTWVGNGYSEAFTENMNHVSEMLKADPEQRILLVRGADDLCAACPNLTEDGTCRSEEKVQGLDARVLGLIGSADSFVSYGKLRSRADAAAGERFPPELCGECEWFELCRSVGQLT